ncbi:MAG: OmpH family outer membrane protein [Bacteroidales bacterium]|nr:OmpH family outer membrane protein [Bacteroidales bacterium]
MKRNILLILLIAATINSFAQKFKYGYINADKVLQEMPDIAAANKELEAYIKPINEYIKAKNEEYQNKLKEFNETQEGLSDFLRKEKENELTKMQVDLRQFQLDAQKEINKKKTVLYQKAIDKLKAAINEVAKENGYRFIIDNSKGVLLYFKKEDNVEHLVKKKLGI